MMPDLSGYIVDIAKKLLGPPNEALSTRAQMRWGNNGSVAVEISGARRGQWYDHENNIGGGAWELLTKKGGMTNGAAARWIRSELGIGIGPAARSSFRSRITDVYDYRDEQGALLFQVCRFEPKDFRQRRPPNGHGKSAWNIKGIRRVPYRLPELLTAPADRTVFIVEGEKDADRLAGIGLVATCNPGGAGKWQSDFREFFGGRDVVIIPDNDDTGRSHAYAVANNLAGIARIRILELPNLKPKGDFSDWLAAGGTREQLDELLAAAPLFRNSTTALATLIIDPGAPFDTARLFLASKHIVDSSRTLHHHRGSFYAWNGKCYPEAEEAAIRAELYRFLDQCVAASKPGKTHKHERYKPNMARVAHILDALKAACIVPSWISAPAWLDHAPDLSPSDIVACENGLLHLPTLDLLRHSPEFFTHNALDFAFERNADQPAAWLRFLSELWPDDAECVDTLQEIFGYALTPDTSQQKAFLIIGPKRSGKGTIARMLTRLVGIGNTVAPTLAGLSTNFGLAPLIGKRLAVISDARLGGRADQHAIAERLLSVTGEDTLTVDRKFQPSWTGRLQTRFVVLSNELPRLADAGGALASRFIVLPLTESFYGRENPGLTNLLLCELPGILSWSIAGLQRLRDRGHFIQPASAAEILQDLEDLGSPINAFLREECRVGSGYTVEVNRLYEVWTEFSKRQGRDHAGTVQTFGRDLRAKLPGLKTIRPRDNERERLRYYQGIGLR
jgi:putative DNA primase/helicase